jgi:hypothetical protein
MSPIYPNSTVEAAKTANNPFVSVRTVLATDIANKVDRRDCEGLRTAVILFSGLSAGMLAIGLVCFFMRRSKWIKKGAEAKQAEYDRLKGGQKDQKGLLWRSMTRLCLLMTPLLIMRIDWPMLFEDMMTMREQ